MAFTATINDYYARLALAAKYEEQLPNYGAHQAFVNDTNKFAPDALASLKGYLNPNQGFNIAVMKKETVAVTNVRSLTVTANEGSSDKYSIVFATLVANMKIAPSAFAGNEVLYEQALQAKMIAVENALIAAADDLAITALETAKNRVDETGGYPYLFAANTYNVENSEREDLLTYIPSIISANNIESEMGLNVISSPLGKQLMTKLMQFGGNNAENKAMNVLGNSYYYTNRLAAGSGNEIAMFAVPQGSLAFLSTIEADCKSKINIGNEIWDSLVFQKLGAEVGYYQKIAGTDISGSNGAGFERAYQSSWQFAFDVAYVIPYSSNRATVPSPVHKFVIENGLS